MLVVATMAKIRRMRFGQKMAIKEICRALKVSRQAVRKVLRPGATDFSYGRKVRPRPEIGPWLEEVDHLPAANAARASRERLSLTQSFAELRGLGCAGGYGAVRRHAAGWKRVRSSITAEA